ncbi:hypothetical protein C1645_823826 [Glomus cerebriforme]|uniref:Uncharacterized protein n=1 Tax=Glomus cerebriforme TaxID=658196 RepID=A0A397T4W4_9GLOM|nr:hypothetical protein C1645_823826 [Glomus cerebriforme]
MSKTCEECNDKYVGYWCNACNAYNAKRFQQNFKNWSSGNYTCRQNSEITAISAFRLCLTDRHLSHAQ